jgi:hypothetical protein
MKMGDIEKIMKLHGIIVNKVSFLEERSNFLVFDPYELLQRNERVRSTSERTSAAVIPSK